MSDEMKLLVLSTRGFNFTVIHVKGKLNIVADYLSRTPCWGLNVDEGEDLDVASDCRRVTTRHTEQNKLADIMTDAAIRDI